MFKIVTESGKVFDSEFMPTDGLYSGEVICSIEYIPEQDATTNLLDLLPVDDAARLLKKQSRDYRVANLVVTVSTGKQFDGDEQSQTRMARAVLAAQQSGATSTQWVLATNELATVSIEELAEALLLAGQAQTVIWADTI